jgi:hypothetical protein
MFACVAFSNAQTIGIDGPSTAKSGDDIVLTFTGETTPLKTVTSARLDVINSSYPSAYMSLGDKGFNIKTSSEGAKITLQAVFLSAGRTNNEQITFKIKYSYNGTAGVGESELSKTISISPPPVQTTFYNAALSRTFVKNNCDATTIGSSVTYTVPANKYSGSTQADADSKAQNDINANGQNYANANGQCLQRFYNTEVSGTFTKQCDVGGTGSQVVYTVPASKHSATSQAAADQLAASDLASNGQSFANANGVCNEVRDASVRYRAFSRPGGACIIANQTQIFVWVGDNFSSDSAYGSLVYSAASGTSKVANGDYKILSTLTPGQTPQSIYVYKVENGRIISSVVCVE